jgi:dienelactone hydrolase
MQTRDIDYFDGPTRLSGYLAIGAAGIGRRPGVLVFHEGLGLGEFAMERARRLAGLGYVAFAADMFGERRQARDLEEAGALIGPLRGNPAALRQRARAACSVLAACPEVDAGSLAAIGFCFGGAVALELARDGADLKAVVSFHGVLTTRSPASEGQVKAAVLVLTGADDPLAPPDQVLGFADEMRSAKVRDWQIEIFGNALHGFTNPSADGSIMRAALHDPRADRRAWASTRRLLEEVFGDGA